MDVSRRPRRWCVVGALAFSPAVGGCDSASAKSFPEPCTVLGVCDEPPKPPIAVDILCDPSVGSPCDAETLAVALDAVLAEIADRPSSPVRFWTLGKTVAETSVLAEQSVPMVAQLSERAMAAKRKQFQQAARAFFLSAAKPSFATPRLRKSPLAEGISKIALADAGGLPRTLVVLTDGREVSALGDFECGALPSDARFLVLLRRRGLLEPGSLRGVTVELSFLRADAVPLRGCPVEVAREARIRALWTTALRAAGAERVRLSSGPPLLGGAEQDPTTKKENL